METQSLSQKTTSSGFSRPLPIICKTSYWTLDLPPTSWNLNKFFKTGIHTATDASTQRKASDFLYVAWSSHCMKHSAIPVSWGVKRQHPIQAICSQTWWNAHENRSRKKATSNCAFLIFSAGFLNVFSFFKTFSMILTPWHTKHYFYFCTYSQCRNPSLQSHGSHWSILTFSP